MQLVLIKNFGSDLPRSVKEPGNYIVLWVNIQMLIAPRRWNPVGTSGLEAKQKTNDCK